MYDTRGWDVGRSDIRGQCIGAVVSSVKVCALILSDLQGVATAC